MNPDPATPSAATETRWAHYLPGAGVAVVTAHSVLLISGGHDDVASLHDKVSAAGDARAVLAAAAGGRVLDLDALPDLALAHRSPTGIRVVLSGRTRCTVVDGDTVTELDGAEVALLGEWGFSATATVELSVHEAGGGEPTWPLSAGVVQADRVRWVAAAGGATEPSVAVSSSSSSARSVAESAPISTSVPAPTSAPTSASPPAPTPTPAFTSTPAGAQASADATLLPEETDEPEVSSQPAAVAEPEPAPPASAPTPVAASAPSQEPAAPSDDWDDGDIDDVEYTVGGGINYDRMFAPAAAPAPTPIPTPTGSGTPSMAPTPTPATSPTPAASPTVVSRVVPSVAPDRGGDTVSPAAAAALRSAPTGSGPVDASEPTNEPGTGPGIVAATQTAARLCPQNHPNPPQLSTCRLCQAPLDGPTVRIARPSLGVVRLSTGMFFDLDRPLLLGREPRIDGVDADSAPRLIVLPSPDKAISRLHLRVDIDGWSVHAVDLGSTNGTYLRRGAADEVRLMPEEPKMLMAGDVLVVDDVRVRFEDLP